MILLTGATGFLGSVILRALLEDGREVCCIKREGSDCGRVAGLAGTCEWHDYAPGVVERIFERDTIEMVIHCATDYGRGDLGFFQAFRANVFFPLEILECAVRHHCRYFINTDTFFVKQIDSLWGNADPLYMGVYTKSKYLLTHMVEDQIGKWDLSFLNLRLEHMYGPGDTRGKFVRYILDQLQENVKEIELTDGLQVRDWIYLDDVVSAYMAVIGSIHQFSDSGVYRFEVGTGEGRSVREFVETAKRLTGSMTELMFGKRKMQRGELTYSCADNQSLRDLGWRPRYGMEDGIRAMIAKRVGMTLNV